MAKIRLFYVSNARLPTEKAHGIQMINFCSAIQHSGIRTTLLAPRRKNTKKLRRVNPYEYYRVEPDFPIVKLPCLDLYQTRFKPARKFAFFLQTWTYMFIVLFYLAGMRAYTALMRERMVVYSRETVTLPILAPLCFALRITHVSETHRTEFKKSKGFFLPILRRVDALIVLTSAMKRRYVSMGVEASKIQVMPLGIRAEDIKLSVSKEKVRDELKLPSDKLMLGYVGSLSPRKGVDDLVEAVAGYLKENKDVRLYIVGGYEKANLDRVRELMAKKVVGGSVTLTGFVEHATAKRYMRAMDVLLFTSRYAPSGTAPGFKEHGGLKVLEYLSAGKPLISVDSPNIREILKHEENSLLFEWKEPEKLVALIDRVLKDGKLSEKLSENSKKTALRYTYGERAKRLKKILVQPA